MRCTVTERNDDDQECEKLDKVVERELACLFEKEIALNRVMEDLKIDIQKNK